MSRVVNYSESNLDKRHDCHFTDKIKLMINPRQVICYYLRHIGRFTLK